MTMIVQRHQSSPCILMEIKTNLGAANSDVEYEGLGEAEGSTPLVALDRATVRE